MLRNTDVKEFYVRAVQLSCQSTIISKYELKIYTDPITSHQFPGPKHHFSTRFLKSASYFIFLLLRFTSLHYFQLLSQKHRSNHVTPLPKPCHVSLLTKAYRLCDLDPLSLWPYPALLFCSLQFERRGLLEFWGCSMHPSASGPMQNVSFI